MTLEEALDDLKKTADAAKSADMERYHKAKRPYLGVANPVIDACAKDWRKSLDLDARLDLAADLWKKH